MTIVSVDLGYGYVKAVSTSGKKVLFPSLVGAGHDRSLAGLFGSQGQDISECHVRVNGQEFFLGELAKKESKNSVRIFEQDRYRHEHTKLMMNAAIQLVTPPEQQVVRLVTGLPLDFYKQQAKEVKRVLEGVYPELEWVSGPLGRATRRISVEQCIVFPQGAGAVMSALYSDQLAPNYPQLVEEGAKVGLIDIGFRTTDFIVVEIQKNGSFKPKPELSGTIDVQGVVNLHRDILRAFKQKTGGSDLSEEYIDRIIRTRMIRYRGQPVRFDETIESSLVHTSTKIADGVKESWNNAMDLLDMIFVAGGGGELYFPYLKKMLSHQLELVSDSQFANALGYLKLGRAIWQAEKRENAM
ncbi:hypothetical protein CathTA2_0667 [Caldalkalibacillus thermarum TA2.A1]|uniref:ParM/StbA family protein n=1 Tax=Caldalkalibacillus thermarum (strain TA2.A1) TaxID=986075 RepID=F5L4F5_CALTT|nr:ParM/StbA family protein [Caldalkalibacillus thermarum]EGL83766.1 hypothetical protein CathTA2_0667 [Caldalkalibacillus thermarum TA2.A1]QZT33720.1 ParM/StbA family protein [Caldalkalibacillus thermarum TA2.A1]